MPAAPQHIISFVRSGSAPRRWPTRSWPFEVLALYMATGKKAPLEDEIAAKQSELAAMKSKMGVAKWCALYRIEMEEADVMAKRPR